jgi:hypothetical protein
VFDDLNHAYHICSLAEVVNHNVFLIQFH